MTIRMYELQTEIHDRLRTMRTCRANLKSTERATLSHNPRVITLQPDLCEIEWVDVNVSSRADPTRQQTIEGECAGAFRDDHGG